MEGRMLVETNMFGETDLSGWWTGLIIGFVLVVAVVVVVGALLAVASRIGARARESVQALDVTRSNTQSIEELRRTNDTLQSILRGARSARQALGG
jgi:hypothetical protein